MSPDTRRLICAAALLLALMVGLNGLVALAGRHSQRQRLLRTLDALPAQSECLFLGDSQVEAGCDAAVFQAAWPNPPRPPLAVNLALGGTSSLEHCLILNRALRRPLRPNLIVYGFSDDKLCASVSGRWRELVGNRALDYYFPSQAAALLWPGSRLAEWQLRLTGDVPMLAERSMLWARVESFRRVLEDLGMPKRPVTRFGRVADFAALEPADAAAFVSRCRAIVEQGRGFSPPVRALLSAARQSGARIFLVEMPIPSRHRQLFYSSPAWLELRAWMQNQAQSEGATYLDASNWMADDQDFEDAIHLNEHGARLFSTRLAKELAGEQAGGHAPAITNYSP